MMRSRLLRSASAIIAVSAAAALLVSCSAPPNATVTTLRVEAGSSQGTVEHVGAGGLYAFADASTPAAATVAPLHLNQVVQPPPV
ncbi:hypothetical protein [Leifsonia poae]|uniref:hypothetical protein n=1 Tax=Leifsonia poae TaxID=110933 RepID=UPI003D67E5F0